MGTSTASVRGSIHIENQDGARGGSVESTAPRSTNPKFSLNSSAAKNTTQRLLSSAKRSNHRRARPKSSYMAKSPSRGAGAWGSAGLSNTVAEMYESHSSFHGSFSQLNQSLSRRDLSPTRKKAGAYVNIE